MRPQSIRKFDLFYLASIALGAVGFFIGFDALVAQVDTELAATGQDFGSIVVWGSFIVGMAISLLLWFFVSRKGSSLAKWLLILLFILGLRGLVGIFAGPLGLLDAINLAVIVLGAAAIFYLFQPDARDWFEKGRDEEESAPSE